MRLDDFTGVNAGYVLELYERYRQDPESVDPEALSRELEEAERELRPGLKLADLARLRERVQAAADRAAWVEYGPPCRPLRHRGRPRGRRR